MLRDVPVLTNCPTLFNRTEAAAWTKAHWASPFPCAGAISGPCFNEPAAPAACQPPPGPDPLDVGQISKNCRWKLFISLQESLKSSHPKTTEILLNLFKITIFLLISSNIFNFPWFKLPRQPCNSKSKTEISQGNLGPLTKVEELWRRSARYGFESMQELWPGWPGAGWGKLQRKWAYHGNYMELP